MIFFLDISAIICWFNSGLSVEGSAMASFAGDFLGHVSRTHSHKGSHPVFGKCGQLNRSRGLTKNYGKNT